MCPGIYYNSKYLETNKFVKDFEQSYLDTIAKFKLLAIGIDIWRHIDWSTLIQLPEGVVSLPESVVTYHQWEPLVFAKAISQGTFSI